MRRREVMIGLFAALLAGCGGSETAVPVSPPVPTQPPAPSTQPTPPPVTPVTPPVVTPVTPPPVVWSMPSEIPFVQGNELPYDLVPTLPTEVKRGGTFAVSVDTPLPQGAYLTADGKLYVGTAQPGTYKGIVFVYEEPN